MVWTVSWFYAGIGRQQWYMRPPLMLAGFERMERDRDVRVECAATPLGLTGATLGFEGQSESSTRP